MKKILIAALLLSVTVARADCVTVALTEDDRAAYDRAAVALAAGSVVGANDADALAHAVITNRRHVFRYPFLVGSLTPEEHALYDALTVKALEGAATLARPVLPVATVVNRVTTQAYAAVKLRTGNVTICTTP